MKKFLAFSLCIVMISMSFVIMSCDNGAESIDTSAKTTTDTTVETSATTSAATSAETTANTSAETTAETTAETVEIDIPDGYQLFSDGYIAFVYPETWSKNDGSVTILSADNGNNITITYEAKTDYYENMSSFSTPRRSLEALTRPKRSLRRASRLL